MKKFVTCCVIAVVCLFNASVDASVIPYGVQTNVDQNTVYNTWGWTIHWTDTYAADNISMSTMFGGLDSDDYVMLAAKHENSNEFALLAATTLAELTTHTQRHQTHASNGAEWYYNGGSMGFAGLGDTIHQSSADTNHTNAELRLSWHTHGSYTSSPTALQYGWRAGATTNLNSSTDWHRYVLVASQVQAVPEPTTLTLWGVLAMVGCGMSARRRKS